MGKSAATSKADTAVKLVLIFFISLMSFSIGTYVGKQVSDSDARHAALESDYGGHGQEHATKDTHAEDAATAPLSDEEVTSLSEEFVKSERKVASAEHAEEAPAAAGAETAEHETPAAEGYTHHSKIKADAHKNSHAGNPAHAEKPTHEGAKETEHSTAAQRVAHDLAPTPDPKKIREPSMTLPTVATTSIGKYTVQVASYATEPEAKEQAAKLSGKGYSAFYIPAVVNGKTWYRVSVGLFPDHKTATNYRTELISTQAVSSAIVQKIVK